MCADDLCNARHLLLGFGLTRIADVCSLSLTNVEDGGGALACTMHTRTTQVFRLNMTTSECSVSSSLFCSCALHVELSLVSCASNHIDPNNKSGAVDAAV